MATFRRAKHSASLAQISSMAVFEQARLRMDRPSAKRVQATLVLSRHMHDFWQLPIAVQRRKIISIAGTVEAGGASFPEAAKITVG